MGHYPTPDRRYFSTSRLFFTVFWGPDGIQVVFASNFHRRPGLRKTGTAVFFSLFLKPPIATKLKGESREVSWPNSNN